ncbi:MULTISPECIES: porin [unclassified Ruegeria]|uniref:porin n=1 Tax=unclassified Ruegeria TaxID=2625375 RepID=UPI001ADC5224|nr:MULTISPECIES: porin [unclassified Ruegeria]MBO9412071.1 porin [Ruegeria sp. R8_1]MBO9417180.1 porin [Ruegeria sp. R8_2]
MKKLLIASTALIATASVAAAEVKFSGYGRFGIGYEEDRSAQTTTTTAGGAVNVNNPSTDNTILVSRFRLNIDANVETDSGVEFQGRVRLQADDDSSTGEQNEAGLNGARFSVIYGGLRVDAGNVSGSFDNLDDYFGNEPGLEEFLGQYVGVNYSFLEYSSTGSGANAVFFRYTVGDFAFSASYDQDTQFLGAGQTDDRDRWDVSGSYTFNNITASLAYGETDEGAGVEKESLAVLTIGAELGDFYGTLFLADDDVADDAENGTAYGLSAAYNVGAATTLQFVYGDGNADDDTRNIGVGAIYDLGNGATLRGAVGEIKDGDEDGRIRADFGAQFNF